ncbi:glutathione S-transferase theta-1-like [Chrysemys picta bellii]|uniref:glutathione S-transferase theta-1-like n=1 Tax=Chrysemys picta bellii TaxID=8478 RepID=UPI0032B23BCA
MGYFLSSLFSAIKIFRSNDFLSDTLAFIGIALIGGNALPISEWPFAGLNIQEFSNTNSLKKVPILKDGSLTLGEREVQHTYHWYPSDLQKRARVDEYRPWQHTTVRANASKMLWVKVSGLNIKSPEYYAPTFLSACLQEALDELNNSLKKFIEKFLQDKPFIVGSEISLADLVAIREFMQPVGAGCNIFEGWPKLVTWHSQVEEAVGKELFQEVHEWILNAQDLRKVQIDPQMKEEMKPKMLK